MNSDKYVKEVLKEIYAKKSVKKRIKEDLLERIETAYDNDPFFDIVKELGKPSEVAKDFMENLDDSELEYGRNRSGVFEYVSKIKIFGVPLIHVHLGNNFQGKVAKGIIAIGNISTGVISIGGISVGIFSIGGISAGVFSIGGISLGMFSIGGIAMGVQAYGDLVVSLR